MLIWISVWWSLSWKSLLRKLSRVVVVESSSLIVHGAGERVDEQPSSQGSNGGLWYGVEDWVGEGRGGADSCGRREERPQCRLFRSSIAERRVLGVGAGFLRSSWKFRVKSSDVRRLWWAQVWCRSRARGSTAAGWYSSACCSSRVKGQYRDLDIAIVLRRARPRPRAKPLNTLNPPPPPTPQQPPSRTSTY